MGIPVGKPSATPATSIWLVISDLPGEDDEQLEKLEKLKHVLRQEVEKTVRATMDQWDTKYLQATRAGIAETKKLRIFVEQS